MATTKKKALGRGINALIREQGFEDAKAIDNTEEAPKEIPVSKVAPNPWQPRKSFSEENIKTFAESIRENGLLQPITVRKKGAGYELVMGERRLRAFKYLEKRMIPAVILDASDSQMRVYALVENVSREDLNPIEAAEGYRQIIENERMKQEDLAHKMGKSRSAITNAMRLLDLPESVKRMLVNGKLTEGHGRALLALENEKDILRFAEEIVEKGYSVRFAEAHAKTAKHKTPGEPKRKDPNIRKLEKDFEKALGTRVTIHDNGGKGKIVVEYYSSDDFARILELIEQ